MSPSAEPAAVAPAAVVSERMLRDGEVVLYAAKPSFWSVLLVSGPVLVAAGLVAVATSLTVPALPVARQTVVLVCVAAACLRVMVACAQWGGRMYVLTNLRVLRISGLTRVELGECALKRIVRVQPSAAVWERAIGTGNLLFHAGEKPDVPAVVWQHLSRPAEVEQLVNEAVRRARGG
ncbi:MAG TPA: hypothetical protein DCX07_04290 [Phycisphaerales bacterium]|nr:hypothetical protein [Phycisphaerales bacterium]